MYYSGPLSETRQITIMYNLIYLTEEPGPPPGLLLGGFMMLGGAERTPD